MYTNQTTDQIVLETRLILGDRTRSPLHLDDVTLSLMQQGDTVIECRLMFAIDFDQYQRIDTDALFNLKPEVRGPLSHGEFQPGPEIQLAVTLQPDLLPRLFAHAAVPAEAATYLVQLSQQQMTSGTQMPAKSAAPPTLDAGADPSKIDLPCSELDPLLSTESWLCLSVKQQQDSDETGYATFWNYVNPSIIHHSDTSSDHVAEGIVNFVKQWTEANLAAATEDATAELLTGLGHVFKDLVDGSLADLDVEDLEVEDGADPDSIFETLTQYFVAEDWAFVRLPEQTTLRLSFQGEQGQWACYAQARDAQSQFVFYSICPIYAPEVKRGAISEFLTRANYGLVLGNFELDFADGEIRYKTSIDVEGTQLNSALIGQLVYANVFMMDEYLPGIVAVLEQDVEPEVAIAAIERTA